MNGAVDSTAPGVVAPVVEQRAPGVYTPAAMRDQVQGDVVVEASVELTGKVSRVRLRQALHPDLDKSALQAALSYRFVPGTRDGSPARVMTPITIEFRLR